MAVNNFQLFRQNKDVLDMLVKRGVVSITHYSYYLLYMQYLETTKCKLELAILNNVSDRTVYRAIEFMERKG